MPEAWAVAVSGAVEAGAVAGAFQLRFNGGGARMAWVAFWANLRTAWTRIPCGDQVLFVTADAYRAVGGHRPWPLLEDVDLAPRLKEHGRIALLQHAILTSPAATSNGGGAPHGTDQLEHPLALQEGSRSGRPGTGVPEIEIQNRK